MSWLVCAVRVAFLEAIRGGGCGRMIKRAHVSYHSRAASHLHLVLPSCSFFHRSNCSWNLTMWKLMPFMTWHGCHAILLLRNSGAWMRLICSCWATMPVVYTSSSLRYVWLRAAAYRSCTTSLVSR